MSNSRLISAFVVLGVTCIGAAWLVSYRSSEVLEYIDRNGHRFHPSETVATQPWWSVYATVGLIAVGIGVILWLLPGVRRRIERLFGDLIKAPRQA